MILLLALLAGPGAQAATPPAAPALEEGEPALRARLTATVREDLQTVTGEIHVWGPEGTQVADLLARLPMPPDDLWLRRTFPLAVEEGRIRTFPLGEEGAWAFVAVLPRRGDASGTVPGAGLFANGLWHPQPLLGASAPLVRWEAEVQAPAGAVTVLNDSVGEGRVRWEGDAERLALAVVPRGRVTRHEVAGGHVDLVDRGPRRRRRDAELVQALAEAWPGPDAPSLVVVETPADRRLARAGPGVLFLSDGAFRLTGPLVRYHRAAVQRGLLRAGLPVPDPWLRAFVADASLQARAAPDPREVLGWLSWIPQIDAMLYDGDLPYYGEVMGRLWPTDPVRDDLLEIQAPSAPPGVVAHRLDHRFGEGTAQAIAGPVLSGLPLEPALEAAGVPPALWDAWRRAPAPEELRVDVQRLGAGEGASFEVELTRQAEEGAPAAPVLVEVDGVARTWDPPAGPGRERFVLPARPDRVVIDPHGDHDQHPSFDRWPRRWTAVVSFFPAELNLNQGRISAYADVVLRRQYDTRQAWDLGLATDPEDLVRAEVGGFHYRGPLSDLRTRPVRLWALASAAVLDPDFRPTDGTVLALGANLGLAWETRVDRDMPLRGHRLALGVDGGLVPGSAARWGALRGEAVGILPLGGRVGLASRAQGGLAQGGVEHRLLVLGGSHGVRGLPVGALVGEAQALGSAELRWQLLRSAALPLGLAWLSSLQLSAGADLGHVTGARAALADPAAAVEPTWTVLGWAASLGGQADVFGVRPTFAGLTVAAAPLAWPLPVQEGAWPEVYLHFDGGF